MHKKRLRSLFLSLDIFIICYVCVRIEVHNLHLVALRAPPPPEEAVLVLAVDNGRQRVADVVIEGRILRIQREVGTLITPLS